jgi:molybdate transport system regulatory protein
MKAKLAHIKPNYKIWLETKDEKGILGDGKWKLLKAIDETGSLKAAMDKLDLSYRKTWNNLKQIEKRLGFPILETSRGGHEGGNTCLTQEGKGIVKAFDNFHKEFDVQIKKAFDSFVKELSAGG